MQFPYLSVLIFTPLAAAVILLLLPNRQARLIRAIALTASALVLGLSAALFFISSPVVDGYRFIEKIDWLPELGISYHVGVDGFSLPLLLLAGLVAFSGVLVSWNVQDRPREFFSFFMFLVASVLGVFSSLDLFQLFFFFELAVFPKYLMIVMWGSPQTREYGGMKLTLYLFLGSVVALVGVFALYFGSGLNTFDMLALEKAGLPLAFQQIWFPVIFIGFAVLAGIFPFYSWAPDGHVAAPTAVSMLLAGVEMKVGAFAALRIGIELLPQGAQHWAWLILLLGTINVVYGALLAMAQKDLKYVIGYSSVSHMGLVLIGFAALNQQGLLGAGLQMFSHGVMTALFFAVVGMVYDRTHTRDIGQLGGLARFMPLAAFGFIVSGLVSMGMPGFSGFVAEIPIYLGAWRVAPWVAVVSAVSIVITAAYILLVVRRVFFGEVPQSLSALEDIHTRDKLVVLMLSLVMIAVGLLPGLISAGISDGVNRILQLLGGSL